LRIASVCDPPARRLPYCLLFFIGSAEAQAQPLAILAQHTFFHVLLDRSFSEASLWPPAAICGKTLQRCIK
jgi:hypothetical protein